MLDIKGILASRTVWTNIIGFMATTPLLAKYLGGLDVSGTADAICAIISAISFLVSSYFRVTATAQLVNKSA